MIRHGQDEGRRTSPCWENDAKVQALRVVLADGHACMVPYRPDCVCGLRV